jgi:VWFA-related protein
MRIATALLVQLVATALASAPAHAQGPAAAAPYVERVDVDEVTLEVRAVDRQGKPVLDLRPEELRLFHNGKPVEITGLTLASGPSPGALTPSSSAASKPAAADAVVPRGDRLSLVVFIDNVHVAPATRRRLLGQLWSFLHGNLEKGDRVMVVVYENRLRVLQPFTEDHDKVLAALAAAEDSFAGMLTAGANERQMMLQIQEFQALQLAGGRGDACTTVIENMARQFGEEQYADARATLSAVGTVVRSLTGIEGRKAVLHVSDGIPLVSGWGPLNKVVELCDGSGVNSGVPFAIDMSSDPHDHVDPRRVQSLLASFDTTGLWQELTAQANVLGVTFFTFEASGLLGAGGVDAGIQSRLGSPGTQAGVRRNRQDTLALVATETGGRAVLDENEAGRGLAAMLGDLRSFYVLSFRPPAAAPGKVYRLRLESTREGVSLRHRRSYRYRSQDERIADRLVASLVHDSEENPLGLGLEVRPAPAPAGGAAPGANAGGEAKSRARVRLTVPVGRLARLTDGAEARSGFIIYVAALRSDGAVTTVRQTTRRLRIPAAQAAAARDYVYEVEMPLPPGENLVGAAVLDELGGGASFVRRKAEMGDSPAGR